MAPEQVFEIGDVASALGVCVTRARSLVAAGRLEPFARTRRGVLLFRPAEVAALRKQREQRARAHAAR